MIPRKVMAGCLSLVGRCYFLVKIPNQEVSMAISVSLGWFMDQKMGGLPRWLNGKESACQAVNVGLIPGLGRSPGGGNGNHSSILHPL